MAKQIWKYPLETGINEITVPECSRILTVKPQKGGMVLYVEVHPKAVHKETLRVLGVCTGTEFEPQSNYEFIDTLMMLNEEFVVHFYRLYKSRGMGLKS